VGKRELDILLSILHAVLTLEVLSSNDASPNDLNGTRPRTMPARHLIVDLGDSPGECEVTVFAVHVMGSGTGVVTEPDAVVLDDAGVLLYDLDAVEDLSGGLLHLTELVHEVPELGLGDGGVGCEDDHAVCLGVWVLVRGGLASDHLVLVHLSCNSHFVYLCCVYVFLCYRISIWYGYEMDMIWMVCMFVFLWYVKKREAEKEMCVSE
jgi:hypothetical protein